MRHPIIITKHAWNKITQILENTKTYSFLFSSKGGGCNGFNYSLETVDKNTIVELKAQSKFPMTKYSYDGNHVFIDPMSEMLLLGTTIDYIKEDYNNQIYESKFIFTPRKELATSCGCGVSFSPRQI